MDVTAIIYTAVTMSIISGIIFAVTRCTQHVYTTWQQGRTVSLRVASTDNPGWSWFVTWLEASDEDVGRITKRKTQHVRLRPRTDAEYGFMPNDMLEPMRFTYRGQLFRMIIQEEKNDNMSIAYPGYNSGDTTRFAAHLWTRGKTVDVFKPLLAEMRDAYRRDEARSTAVYVPIHGGQIMNWSPIRRSARRAFKTLVLSADVRRRMLHDIATFVSTTTRDRYEELAVPYRRTWLLYGPPGNGKSSCALAVADYLKSSLRLLSLNDPKLTDANLADLINVHPLRSRPDNIALIVLEDVDALFANRAVPTTTTTPAPAGPTVTLSGLLNALDGAAAPEYTFIIMTTNFPERLDAALDRAGRVDQRFEFGVPTDDMIKDMMLRFNPRATPEEVHAFVTHWKADKEAVNMARVQEAARALGQ